MAMLLPLHSARIDLCHYNESEQNFFNGEAVEVRERESQSSSIISTADTPRNT